jgi:hypothetical protein
MLNGVMMTSALSAGLFIFGSALRDYKTVKDIGWQVRDDALESQSARSSSARGGTDEGARDQTRVPSWDVTGHNGLITPRI